MSTAKIGWSVDDKEVLKSFQKQQAEFDKLKKKVEELQRASKTASDEGKKGFDSVAKGLSAGVASINSMIVGMFTIDRAIGLISSEYEDWVRNSERLRDQHDALHKSILSTLAAAGQLSRTAEFEERARNIPGATAAQVRTAFAAVEQAAPGLGFERHMELAGQAAPLGVLGIDLTQFGAALGDLAEAEPGKSAKDLVDLASALQRLTGDKFGEISSDKTQRVAAELRAAGMTGPEALGLFVAGRQANLDPRTMETLATALASQEGLAKAAPGRRLTDADRLKNEFLATGGPQARLSLLQQRPDVARAVLGEGFDTRIGLLTPGAIQAAAGQLGAPPSATAQLSRLPGRSGAEAQMEQFLAGEDEQDRASAEREKTAEVMDRFLKRRGYWSVARELFKLDIRQAEDPEQFAIGQLQHERRAYSDPKIIAKFDEMISLLRNLDANSVRPAVVRNQHNE